MRKGRGRSNAQQRLEVAELADNRLAGISKIDIGPYQQLAAYVSYSKDG